MQKLGKHQRRRGICTPSGTTALTVTRQWHAKLPLQRTASARTRAAHPVPLHDTKTQECTTQPLRVTHRHCRMHEYRIHISHNCTTSPKTRSATRRRHSPSNHHTTHTLSPKAADHHYTLVLRGLQCPGDLIVNKQQGHKIEWCARRGCGRARACVRRSGGWRKHTPLPKAHRTVADTAPQRRREQPPQRTT